MITLSAALNSLRVKHSVMGLTACWKIVRTDGQTFRFTEHNEKLTINGEVYTPASGVMTTAREKQAGLKNATLETVGVIDDSSITDEDLRKGLFNQARVSEYIVDWRWPWAGIFMTTLWFIERVKWDEEQWHGTMMGLAGRLRTKIGGNMVRGCMNRLGDSRCRVDIEALAVTATVTAVDSNNPRQLFETDITGQADDYFNEGKLQWLTGNNANDGLISQVQKYLEVDGTLYLTMPAPVNVEVGDTLKVYPGCARTREACRSFPDPDDPSYVGGNIKNYNGFPTVPGTDAVYRVNINV